MNMKFLKLHFIAWLVEVRQREMCHEIIIHIEQWEIFFFVSSMKVIL